MIVPAKGPIGEPRPHHEVIAELEREEQDRLEASSRKYLTKKGSLKKQFQPAIYLDSNILIDYIAHDLLEEQTIDLQIPQDELEDLSGLDLSFEMIRTYLRSDRHLKNGELIKAGLRQQKSKILPVTSPYAVFELNEWYAESTLKNLAAFAAGKAIQKWGKKDTGRFLAKVYQQQKSEEWASCLYWETYASSLYRRLKNIAVLEVKGLDVAVDDLFNKYAYLQIGLADLLHILTAKHLGCKYIASFDSDFERISGFLLKDFEIITITKLDDLLGHLKGETLQSPP